MTASTTTGHARWKSRIILFLGSQTLSLFGSALVQYAIIWHITLSTGSGAMLTVSTVCGFAPQLLVALLAGGWLDRYSRKRIILYADGLIACTTLLLAIAFWCGTGSLWMLFAALAVRSAGAGIQTPAVQALIPQITPPEQLGRVNGLNGALSALTTVLAPAASAALLTVWSRLEVIFLVDVLTAVVGMSVLAGLFVPGVVREGAGLSALEELRAGVACLKSERGLARLLTFQAAVLTLISPAAFLTPLLVSRMFGPQVWRLSVSEMTYSAGAVAGGLLMAAWGGWRVRLHTVYTAGVVYGLGMIGMGLVSTVGAALAFPAYLACNALMGVTAPCYGSALTTHIQERVPSHLHGRVFAFMQVVNGCAFPAGMLIFGPLADSVPLTWLLFGCGVGVLCSTLWVSGGTRMLQD